MLFRSTVAAGNDTRITGALQSASNLSDLGSASTARTNLGLGSMAVQASSSVTITGGSITGVTDIAVADGGTGASDALNATKNLSAISYASFVFGDDTSGPFTLDVDGHGFQAASVQVMAVRDEATGDQIIMGVSVDRSTGDITLSGNSVVGEGSRRVYLMGISTGTAGTGF